MNIDENGRIHCEAGCIPTEHGDRFRPDLPVGGDKCI